jgi:Tfp pilus assembly protein PilV
MKSILLKPFYKKSAVESAQGFSLIETVIALTTLGVCLAYAMPLFLYAKINNSKSEIRTGALIVSQRIFDDIRSKSIASAPLTNGTTRDPDKKNDGTGQDKDPKDITPTSWKTGLNSDATNPIVIPDNASVTENEKLRTYTMGRQYRAKVTYCGKEATDTTEVCSAEYRKFKVEVSYNGTKVYDLEGTYTEFK